MTPDRASSSDTFGRFTVEPFERGIGASVATSLRRLLLSSLEGSAITKIKIQGVLHEITSIPGVVEDVTDIVLNIKSLIVKNLNEEPQTIRIERKEKGTVKAADIQHNSMIQIINPEHVIATLTADVPFVIEMTVENGRGYRSADEVREREIGIIPIDAAFSPVTHVRHAVEETRVGQKTNYDKLTIEVTTNGTITPHMALVEAAKILRKHLNPFVQYADPGMELPIEDRLDSVERPMMVSSGGDPELERKLNMSLAELELSVRATNCLESENITSVRDLVMRSEDELLEVRNLGATTLTEVKQKLVQMNMSLGMKLPAALKQRN